MKCERSWLRLACAAIVLVVCLAGVAAQRVTDSPRLSLLLFTDPPNCDPCKLLEHAIATDRRFKAALYNSFRCSPSYKPATAPDMFRKYKIQRVPTCIILDAAGNELNRIEGFWNPTEFWGRLTSVCANGVCRPLLPGDSGPAASSADGADVTDSLRSANKAMERELDALRANQRALEKRLLDAQSRAKTGASDSADSLALRQEIARLQKQQQQAAAQAALQAKRIEAANLAAQNSVATAEDLRKRLALPDAPLADTTATATDPAPEQQPKPAALEPTSDRDESPMSGLAHNAAEVILDYGVPAALGAAGVAIPGGPLLWWFAKRRIRKRLGGSKTEGGEVSAGATFP